MESQYQVSVKLSLAVQPVFTKQSKYTEDSDSTSRIFYNLCHKLCDTSVCESRLKGLRITGVNITDTPRRGITLEALFCRGSCSNLSHASIMGVL